VVNEKGPESDFRIERNAALNEQGWCVRGDSLGRAGRVHGLTYVAMLARLLAKMIVESKCHKDRRVQDKNKSCDLFQFHIALILLLALSCQQSTHFQANNLLDH